MARFETPINDPQVAKALRGLDYQSVMISRSFDQSSHLNAFIDQYVDPETLEFETPEHGVHHYDYSRFSAIGDDGSLLHVRLHRQTTGQVIDPSIRHLAVISHIDDDQPATILPARAEDTVGYDAVRTSTFIVGRPEEPGLQVVESPMNPLQWEVEKVLARELAVASLPLIAIRTNGWEYRRSDGHWEKLRDIRTVRERVSAALSQGLGYAALPEIRSEPPVETGQFTQKVLA